MEKFGLKLHPDKTRLIDFGRGSAAKRERDGRGRCETFDFLGFTHICGKTRRAKRFALQRKTIAKRMRRTLASVKEQLQKRRHDWNNMPATILLDVMETLVTEPYYRAMPEFFGMTLEELRDAKHPTSWIEFEEGKLTEAEYIPLFFRDGRPVDGDGLRRCVMETYQWLDGMQQLLTDLKTAGHSLHALSNYPVWYQLIEKRLQLSRFLHWSFVSCQTGVRKPDPRAFLGAVETLQIPPGQCVFIDDQLRNVEAAQSVGMDAIHRQSAAQVREELVQRGLLAS